MAIQELYDPGYFDYQVQRHNGKVDSIKLQSPLLNQAVTVQNLVYSYYYFRCAADLMEDENNKWRDVRDYQYDRDTRQLLDPKQNDRSGKHKDKIQKAFYHCGAPQRISYFQEAPPLDDFALLPDHSWLLQLNIQLTEPFLSNGDDEFYPLENSVCRDTASGLPMIKSTTWKGNFLSASYYWRPARQFLTSSYRSCDWNDFEKRLIGGLNEKQANRAVEIFGEYNGLANCPLLAWEEIYRMLAGEKDKKLKQWARLRIQARTDEDKAAEFSRHPLTLMHRLRGPALAILDRLGGSDDDIYGADKQYQSEDPNTGSKDSDVDKQAPRHGQLFFFPSYFSRVDYDVIAPVDRVTRSVNQPIPIEMIPAKQSSQLRLFYLARPEINESQSWQDLCFCGNIIQLVLEELGFSAKAKTGYGRAQITGGEVLFNRPQQSTSGPGAKLASQWQSDCRQQPATTTFTFAGRNSHGFHDFLKAAFAIGGG